MVTAEEIRRIVERVPGGAANIADIYPLAPLQEGILFHYLLASEGDPYLSRSMLRFDSRTRLDRFVAALQAVVDRHDILRTAIVWEGLSQPAQVVLRRASLLVEEVVLDPQDGDVSEQLAIRFDPRGYRIDVREAPLLRVAIAHDTSADRWSMALLFHHLATDHTTLEVIFEEVRAYLAGRADALPTPLPFKNYVAQARLGVSVEEHETFFSEMLSDVDEPTIPLGVNDTRGDGSSIVQARRQLPIDLAQAVRACARTLGVSAASICHLAWARVLGVLSRRDDVVFGTVLFGRMQGGEGTDRVLGLLINTLPLRVAVGDADVRSAVRDTHALLARLLRHEHASLALAQRCSAVSAPAPLFSALLNYRHSGRSGAPRQPWEGIEALGGEERTNYPLSLSVDDQGEGFRLTAQAQTGLDPARICHFMETSLRHLTDALEAAPETPVRAIPLLDADERERLVVEWNATERVYPADRCVHQLFEVQAAEGPDELAIVHGDAAYSYGDLNARANRLARYLREIGVAPADRVALSLDRGVDLVAAQLAVLKCAAAYVPLDRAAPMDRQRFMIEDGGITVVLARRGEDVVTADGLRRVDLDAIDLTDRDARDLDVPCTSESPAYIIYTSGSTGTPKGVVAPHRAVGRVVLNNGYAEFLPSDRIAFAANPAFDASTMEVWGALLNGGCCVVVDRDAFLDPTRFAHALEQQKISVLFLTTALFNEYAAAIPSSLGAVRVLLCGGEKNLPASFRSVLAERTALQHLLHVYGPTETTTFASSYDVHEVAEGTTNVPIGRPIANTRAYIVDAYGELVPIGVAGELTIGGTGVALGYLNRPELTAERFVANPFVAGDRLYRTGDLVRYLVDGSIEFVGRTDAQVKIRGFRIELGEIEACLARHEEIGEAVVLAREDAPGEKRLVAYYTLSDGIAELRAETLRAHIASALPEYMVPAAYVVLEALPLTPNGKIDRKALPAPDGGAYAAQVYQAPVGEIEQTLARLWCEVLNVERVGRRDNFFELGGHSLLVVRIIEHMRRAGLHADVSSVFNAPTLAELAACVTSEIGTIDVPANGIPGDCTAIIPEMLPLVDLTLRDIERIVRRVPGGAANVADIYPLAPLQEGILFHHVLAAGNDPYLLHSRLRFDGRARLDRFVAALQAVIDRHDILRTAIVWEELALPVQVVYRRARLDVEEVDRSRLDPHGYRIDMSRAPLMRAVIARDADAEHWSMVLFFHHAVVDHTTLEVVFEEVRAHLLGAEAELGEPLPFRTFVARARLGVGQDEHEAFFGEMLSDVEEPTMPLALPARRADEGSAQSRREIPKMLARRLRAAARAMSVSVASLCHLAWARVLSELSGSQDVVFGTVLFGRMQGGEGAERALGLFINTLPIRLSVSETGVAEAVIQTHALLARLMRHEHASLALAQRCSSVAAPAPLFGALMNYRHSARASEAGRRAWEGIETLGGQERSNYPLAFSVDDLGEDFLLTAQVNVDIDPDRICGFMQTVMEQMVDALELAPSTSVRALALMQPDERERVLVEWNATDAVYPADRCVHALFESQVIATPDAVAVVHGDVACTYAQLNARSNRIARRLQELGVEPGARVALALERSVELVAAQLAVLKCGGAYVPLDTAAPVERQRFMLRDAGARFVLGTGGAEVVETRDVVRVDVDTADVNRCEAHDLELPSSSESVAYVMYTSGSTGEPKGVVVPHRAIGRVAINNGYARFTADDRIAFAANPAFDASTMEVWGALLNGGSCVIVDREAFLEAALFARFIAEQRVTVLFLTTALFNEYATAIPSILAGIRIVLCGGEKNLPAAFRAVLQARSCEHELVHVYGPTETTTFALSYVVDEVTERTENIPIGRPISNTRAYVLNGWFEPVPPGVAGELYLGGAGVAHGYLDRPELTAQRFIASPFVEGDRLYKTGDLVRYRTDGAVEFLGRTDFQVKIRGFRIELGEIEAQLAQHDAVREAIVSAREDELGEKRLVAYVTLVDGAEADAETLRAHLASQLPEYMVPAAYVRLKALPLTPNGKVDRKALPAPEDDAYGARVYEAPIGEIEQTLSHLWAEILDVERIGRNDNFFELGGHSLLVVRLVEQMRRLGLHADVAAVFNVPTLAALAACVRSESALVDVPARRIPDGCTSITPEMLPLIDLRSDEIERIVSHVPGGAPNVADIYPLAPLQEGILFHHVLAEEGDPYLLRSVLRFESRARLDAFASALQAVIDRHDILRTAILWEGLPESVQVVLHRAHLLVEEVVVEAEDVSAALASRFDPGSYRLDVRRAPMLRLSIAHDPVARCWIGVLLCHHLVCDHTTLEVIFDEIRAIVAGEAAALPEPLPFRTFVAQARLGVAVEQHEAFFAEMLGGVDESTAPYGIRDVRGDGATVAQARVRLERSLALRMRARAQAAGVSAASLCHLAWARVLAALSGREDVVFGTVLVGRMHGGEGADRVLGLFINTLPLRIDLREDGVKTGLRNTHSLLAHLMRHEHASLALAQRCSAVAAPAPLFNALLNYRHSRPSVGARAGLSGIEAIGGEERTNYPLVLSVDDLGEDFVLTAQARHEIDPQRICAYMQTTLERIVEALESAPQTPVLGVDVLSPAERRRLLVEWNATQIPFEEGRCVHELFERWAAASPEALALAHDEKRIGYRELNEQANRLARHLRKIGVKPGARVALCFERSTEMVVGLIAVLKAGGAYVPLDTTYPLERLAYMLDDSAPIVVLTHAAAPSSLRELLSDRAAIDLDTDVSHWEHEAASDPAFDDVTSRDVAYVIYTSGSTGRPKGVMLEHRGVVNLAAVQAQRCEIRPESRVLQFSSPSFDAFVFEVVMALSHGASLHVPSAGRILVGETLIDVIESSAITHTLLPPVVLTALPAHVELPSIQTLVIGGDALTAELVERWAPGRRVINAYGPTESTVCATLWDAECEGTIVPPIGRPIGNTRVYILDAHGEPVPIGVAGELYVGGAGVARGYLHRPELTAERFLESAFVAGDRLYRTGDLARYLDDGTIAFLGRADFQVKLRGFRVELGEIEARLRQHEGISDAVVAAREDVPGEKNLVAYYTLADGRAVDVERLRSHLASTLPEYMVPAAYVELDALPLTPNGKLDRKALPAPDGSSYLARAFEAPAGEIEQQLAAIWVELLKVERVGRNDNFFELGGHSLIVVRMVERMRALGLYVDVASVFSAPTLAGVAVRVERDSAGIAVPPRRVPDGCTAITPEMLSLVDLSADEIARVVATVPGGAANVAEIYPLAPLQEGILFHHMRASEGDPYLLRSVLRFDSRARLDRFVAALQVVVDRHDILRTAVVWEGLSEPVQVVWRSATLVLEEVDTGGADASAFLTQHFDPRTYRMDVRQAPLLRLVAAEDRVAERWSVILLFHHLACDHTTLEVIFDEVRAVLAGKMHALPAPLPFRSFVARARSRVGMGEHEAFFGEMLGDVVEPTTPYGANDAHADGSAISESRVRIDRGLSQRLRARARSLGVSVASLYHLAWARVLGALSGRDDVVFGTVLFGRMQGGEGADRVLGLFINTLPIRIRLGEDSVEEGVRKTQASLAQLVRYEHASLAIAQRCSAVAPPTPLFSVLLNYRHSGASSTEPFEGIEAIRGEERTNYPLVLSVDDFGDDFALTAQTQGDIDPHRICGFMQCALEELLGALAIAPATPVRCLPVLSSSERERLLVEWNATDALFPYESCVHELFEMEAAKAPTALAVTDGLRQMTYTELNARANQLAHYLHGVGVLPGTRVAISLERSIELVTAELAVLKCGAAYVPLDRHAPPERRRFMLEDGDIRVLLSLREEEVVTPPDTLRIDLDDLDVDALDNENPKRSLPTSSAAYVMYTSGSTGEPKGAIIPHHAIARLVINNGYARFTSADRVAFAANPAFDASTLEMWAPLLNGGCLVIVDRPTLLDPDRLSAYLVRLGVTALFLTAGFFAKYADLLVDVVPRLRYLMVGGDVLDVGACERVLRNGAPQHLLNLYGPTETTTFALCREVTEIVDGTTSIPLGRPIANARVYILDRHRELVPVGVPGELYIGGAGVGNGYLHRPELTAERFIESPFVPGDRLYKTGDLVRYRSDGTIEFLGRIDFQVKIRGFRIELGEIEACLRRYPEIVEIVVLAREDVPGEKRLVAYYTLTERGEATTEMLRAHVAATLPEYMLPVAYVCVDAFPLTPNGKIDRKALAAPEGSAFGERRHEPPFGAVEEHLAQMWCEVLGVERVGRFDNFFALGGHSLLVVRLIEHMRRAGLRADVSAVFTAPTLAALAASVESERGEVRVPPRAIPDGATSIEPEMLPLVKLRVDEIERIVDAVPGGAANIADIYPLAPLQEGILFHHILAPANDPYLLRSGLRFKTRVGVDRFVAALQWVADRHDILRTAVLWEGLEEPVQVVLRSAQVVLEELPVERGRDAAGVLAEHLAPGEYTMDVRRAPLLRVAIAQNASTDEWLMVLLFHHVAMDHTTLELVFDEVRAYLEGRTERLPEPLPFRNFVAQARFGISREAHEAFFSEMLRDVAEPTIPVGLGDVLGDGSQIVQRRIELPLALAKRLRAHARALGVSAASLWHLAWARVLGVLSGREDVVFGTVLFGRMQGGEGADRALGLFMNTLPVRIVTGNESVRDAVRTTQSRLADLLRHEHAPLSLAQRCSMLPAATPLFSALLNYRHTDPAYAASEEPTDAFESMGRQERTNYPLTLAVDDLGEAFALTAQVHEALDPERICAFVQTALERLTDALDEAPTAPVRSIGILSSDELERIVQTWNTTEALYPHDRCVHELIEAHATTAPRATAVTFGETQVTYDALNRRANRLARHLRRLGVRPDARVALCVERGLDAIVGMLAILKAGGAYVPLDPLYPQDRLAYMLEDSGPVVVLTHDAVPASVREMLRASNLAVVDMHVDRAQWEAEAEHDLDRAELTPRHLAYVIYTSGSTGQPKGVMMEHRSAANRIHAQASITPIADGDVFAQKTALGFVDAFFEILSPLAWGRPLVVIPAEDAKDPVSLIAALAKHHVSHLVSVPSLAAVMDLESTELPELRSWTLSGEALSGALVRRLQASLPRCRFINLYGSTEVAGDATRYEVTGVESQAVPIGRPIANTRAYVLDAQLTPVPIGVTGELFIGGAQVARGYLNRPELTAERFVADPFSREVGARLYRTGDLARYRSDGEIEYLGRTDFQVKIRGFRVELGEIEAQLTRVDAVREAVVLARADTSGEQRLVAYYVLSDGAVDDVTIESLRLHLGAALPEYMVPAAYVRLDAMPLTPNGKLDRKALPSPDGSAYLSRVYEEPDGEAEIAIAQIWCDLLGVDRVGRNDHFFELGGHSLLAVRMNERMRSAGLHVDVRAIFTSPTLAALAAVTREEILI